MHESTSPSKETPVASEGYHEPVERLRPETVDHHRAIVSLMEELEAVDWYDQRVDATDDDELRAILAHNRDEEKEHAAMTLEWLRRRDPTFDEELRTYLFTDGPIVGVEAEAMGRTDDDESGHDAAHDDVPSPSADGSLGIGSLRGEELR
jgi:uncharacterized protein